MNKILVFVFLIGSLDIVSGQSACTTYGGNYSRILSTLKAKNTRTDRHKLTESHLQSIAAYWVAVCECEKGVPGARAQEVANTINNNDTHFTDTFLDRGTPVKKEVGHFGDLYPTNRLATKSGCMGGDGGDFTNPSDLLDCAEAKSFTNKAKDPQGMGRAFFRAYCECKNGVANEERAKQLEVEMQINYSNYKQFRTQGDPIISVRPLSASNCPLGGGVAGAPKPLFKRSAGEILTGDELSNALTQFVGELSSFSDSPGLQALAQEMSANQQKIDQIRSNAEIFGPLDQNSVAMLNFAENVMQAISIGKAIFGKNKEPSLEATLSADQLQLRELMGELSSKLRVIYDEVQVIPNYPVYNESVLASLKKIEDRFYKYHISTAQARLKYLWYIDFDGYPTMGQFQAESQRIDKLNSKQLIYEIETIQSRYKMSNILHMANEEVAFSRIQEKINLLKVRVYEQLGDKLRAQKYRSLLTYEVSINEAIKLSQEAFDQNDFYSTTRYTEIIVDHFRNESMLSLLYTDLMSLSYDFEGIKRHEINYIMSLGIFSYIHSGQLTQAKEAFKGLKTFHATFNRTFESFLEKKARNKQWTDEEFRAENARSKMIMLAAQAFLESALGDFESAKTHINESLQINELYPDMMAAPFGSWLMYVELQILVKGGAFSEAAQVMRVLKLTLRVATPFKLVEKEELDFLNAYLRYVKGDYKGASLALRILKAKGIPGPRVFSLEEKIFEGLGDNHKALEARKNYNLTLTKNKN